MRKVEQFLSRCIAVIKIYLLSKQCFRLFSDNEKEKVPRPEDFLKFFWSLVQDKWYDKK